MAYRILLSLAALLLLAAGAQAAPKSEKECPIEDFSLDKIQEAARDAPSCDKSLEVFRLCGAGASSDVALGGIVTEKCEAEFLTRLSKRERRAYTREQQRCAGKFRHEAGTMYRSFEAFCGAALAGDYARRFARRKAASPRVQ